MVGIVSMLGWGFVTNQKSAAGGRAGDALAACPDKPNCVCSSDTRPEHAIPPLTFTGDPQLAWQRLEKVLQAQPRLEIVQNEADYRHVVFTTLLLRFRDDCEFLLRPAQSIIEVRSASRVGRSDLGVNRRRIESLRAAFERAGP